MNVIVAIGGSFPDNSAEIFNVSTLQWTRSLNTMPGHLMGHTATLLPNEQILVVGGGTIRPYLFNPTTKLFTFAADTIQPRNEPSVTLLPSGLVLITGGYYMDSIYRSAEVYDYRLNIWRSVLDMNTARFHHTSVVLNHSSSTSPIVLVIGGKKELDTSSTSCELFSINS
ncbi:unnamed protein product [Adineta steineri]|uniref:Uncharacterized protein n=1 Tax=Adineta steineri TaxID=433720 RepID=A0A813XHI1_9BILA|nr:unnamed protein product [Adineta steineri]CAF3616023.1 unnamed protein product [Adineta steineri]